MPAPVRKWLDQLTSQSPQEREVSTIRELAEIKALLQTKREVERREYESLPALLRRVTEIERLLKATELHIPPRYTRRRLT